MAQEVLVGGGLGVDVQNDTAGAVADGLENAVGGAEGTVHGAHEGAAEDAESGDWCAVASRCQGEFTAGSVGRKVGRFADALVGFQGARNVLLLVDVIAKSDEIDAGVADFAIQVRRQPGTVGRILGVGDDEVEPLPRN